MRSIDECISLFNRRDGNEYSAVRQMESLSEWELAAEYWDKLGKFNDAKACRMGYNSVVYQGQYKWLFKILEQ